MRQRRLILWTSPNPPFAMSDSCAMERFLPVIQAYSEFRSLGLPRAGGISVKYQKEPEMLGMRYGGNQEQRGCRWVQVREHSHTRTSVGQLEAAYLQPPIHPGPGCLTFGEGNLELFLFQTPMTIKFTSSTIVERESLVTIHISSLSEEPLVHRNAITALRGGELGR